MRTIETASDINEGLQALLAADARLKPIAAMVKQFPLRSLPSGFEGLAGIVISQQVSKQSAEAIEGRLRAMVVPLTADVFVAAGEDVYRAVGLSRPKQRTLLAVAEAVQSGTLDLDIVCTLPPADAAAQLTAIKGIGPWTAEVYLLFCAGHCDIFPAGDLALQIAVQEGLGLKARPSAQQTAVIAESWSPWRGVAARLFWAYYGAMRQRQAMP